MAGWRYAAAAVASRFDTDTAVEPLGDGRWACRLDRGWWIVRGPNGGYLAAIVLRAMAAEVADPERHPRSLTLHYLRPPREGPAEVRVTVERTGRTTTTLTARMVQDDRLCIIGIAAFGTPLPGPTWDRLPAPAVPPPGEVPEVDTSGGAGIPMRERWRYRYVFGPPPPGTGDEAVTGGWMRLREPRVIDEVLVAAMSDSWPPAVFAAPLPPTAAPTVDLTVHFRHRLPLEDLPPDGWVLARFRTRVVRDGFLDEDGELWAPDGTLLAQSRQLALALPAEAGGVPPGITPGSSPGP